MVANIDMTNGRANIAYLGKREDVWHHLGQEMLPGMDIDTWAKQAGLSHEVIKVPAYAHLDDETFSHVNDRIVRVPGKFFLARSDNGHPLGLASAKYKIVQPKEVLEWFEQYVAVDDRFEIDVAGSLQDGAIVWATAKFRDTIQVAGDDHVCHLLMTTSYNGVMATINQPTTTRVVCNNTLDIALADASAVVRTRHSKVFDGKKVAEELAAVAQGFEAYKKMGDAMAKVRLSEKQVDDFFNKILGIKEDDSELSTRKLNQRVALVDAYSTTVADEGATRGSAWAVLQAVTRYVDHDRIANDNKRDLSSTFGSGALMKREAFKLLMAA